MGHWAALMIIYRDMIFQSVKFWPQILVPRGILQNPKKFNCSDFQAQSNLREISLELRYSSHSYPSQTHIFWEMILKNSHIDFSPLPIPSSKSPKNQEKNFSSNLFKLQIIWSSNIWQGRSHISNSSFLSKNSRLGFFHLSKFKSLVQIPNSLLGFERYQQSLIDCQDQFNS